jgi:mannosyltransferase OCH1-like enzyme
MKHWWVYVTVFIVIILVLFRQRKTSYMEDKIPKIIHQTAPSDETKWESVWKKCQDSWKTLHPDFDYRFWSDEDMEKVVKEEYPDFYESTFSKYPHKIQKIDAFRPLVLKKYGGVYADMDFECINRFVDDLPSDKVSAGEAIYEHDEGFQNALMISPKEHPFWDFFIEDMKTAFVEKSENELGKFSYVLNTTGPVLLSRCIKKHPDMINPLNGKEYHEGIFSKHHNTGSWNK